MYVIGRRRARKQDGYNTAVEWIKLRVRGGEVLRGDMDTDM